jgi:hypothetical protein
MEKNSHKPSFHKILGNIAGYVIYPIILVAVLSTLVVLISTPGGKIPQFFGVSLVKILTGSMTSAGFYKDDVVLISQQIDPNELQNRQVIAFYNFSDPADRVVISKLVKKSEWDGVKTGQNFVVGQQVTRTQVEQNKTAVYFHYINEVYVNPADGTLYFQTIGANPGASPDGFIRQDFIVGKYVNTPNFLRAIMSFASTSLGIVLLVVLPLSILVLMECFGLIEHISAVGYDAKVFNRQIAFDSPEAKKYNVGKEMDLPRKIYFYATAKEEEKDRVFDFLFEHLQSGTAKEQQLYALAQESKQKLQTSAKDYFVFWQSNLQKQTHKKQLKKLENQFFYESYLKNLKK